MAESTGAADLFRHALAAYFRGGSTEWPTITASRIAEHEGQVYVVLRRVQRGDPLAVYRVSKAGLRRMRRWPTGLYMATASEAQIAAMLRRLAPEKYGRET